MALKIMSHMVPEMERIDTKWKEQYVEGLTCDYCQEKERIKKEWSNKKWIVSFIAVDLFLLFQSLQMFPK